MKVIIGRSAYGLEGVSNVDPVRKGLECASAVEKGVYQIAVISHFMLERSAQLKIKERGADNRATSVIFIPGGAHRGGVIWFWKVRDALRYGKPRHVSPSRFGASLGPRDWESRWRVDAGPSHCRLYHGGRLRIGSWPLSSA